MANTAQKTFSFPFKDIIVDEIALEGLEGIDIDYLWRRIEKRISSPVTEKMQNRFWNIILKCNSIYFFENPVPMPRKEIIDRFTIIDEASGDLKEPDDYLDGPYEYCPIENENGCEGSCVHYDTRKLLDKSKLSQISYQDVMSQYSNTLVLVASRKERWAALAPHLPISYLAQLTKLHYCILELIGKSRENGQMTVGKTNLAKIVKDAKLLFYNRKVLQQLDLVRVSHITQVANKGGTKAILLRLRRFHQTSVQSVPKVGWINTLVEYLSEQPNYCESTETAILKGLLTQKQNKRFQKKFYIFGFDETPIKLEEVTAVKKRERISKKRRYIYLSSITDDESSESDDEDQKTHLQCQYKVGVQLLRQAYETFLDAGLEGLTQIQLGQLLGVEFYISRTICRLFKSKNIVREFLEDKGRQRTSRFIAVAATAKMDNQYKEEKEKFMKYVDECANLKIEDNQTNDLCDSDCPVPKKKIKIEKATEENSDDEYENIFEIKQIEGQTKTNTVTLADSTKRPSLRQLRFATGALKVIKERQVIVGFHELGKLISAEINEPPMDNKAMKKFLQRLINDGCVKLLGIRSPGQVDKYTTIICAPHINKSHPHIKAKCKSIVKTAKLNREKAKRSLCTLRPLTQYSFPRYLKLQRLHEAVIKYAYFDDVKPSDLPKGFVYIKDLIPELTLEIALGTINSAGVLNIKRFHIDDDLYQKKVREIPDDLRRALTSTTHLASSIRINLKTLASLGLLQMVAQVAPGTTVPDNSFAIHIFYVNKNATIIDTSGTWPRKEECQGNLEKKFYFKTFDDVKDFWNTVFNISSNTTVEVPNRRELKPPVAPVRAAHEVEQYDVGLRFGNQLGPCGFDAAYYLDVSRLWRAYCARSNTFGHQKPNQVVKKIVKIPKPEKTKRKVQKIRKKTIQKPKLCEKPPQIKKTHIKQALRHAPLTRTRKKVVDTLNWTLEDDKIMTFGKAAITIMSPMSQPGCVQIRNLVVKDILSLRDPKKNQKLCYRRAAIVDNNSTMRHLKDCILTEIKNHNSILQKYENMLRRLRIQSNATQSPMAYIMAARLPMIELVWTLMEVWKVCSTKQRVPIFTNLEEFHSQYNIVPSSANRAGSTYKSAPNDIVHGPLKESIMLNVMLSFENTVSKDIAKKLFQHFKRYDERTLRQAVVELRQCGAMAAKEKILNGLLHKVNLDDIVDCWFKLSAVYQRKWLIRLNAEFVENLGKYADKTPSQDDLKGNPESNCFCSELLVTGVIDVNMIIAPVISGFTGSIVQEDQLNAIDIESRYKLKAGTYGWKAKRSIKKIGAIYDGVDIEEPFQQILRNSVINQNDKPAKDIEKQLTDVERNIIIHIKTKAELGSTFQQLKEITGEETEALKTILTKLINENVVKRVGVYDNFIVLIDYIKTWSMEANSYFILSKPWLTINTEIRKNIFLKWAGVVLNKIFECPGIKFTDLSDGCEYLSTTAVQDVCEVLCKWGCVLLHTMIAKEPDFFSEDDDVPPELSDYNMYESPQNMIVLPTADCLVRYAFIRQTILSGIK